MVWLQATYLPTTLFSLRPSWATSSGGKSLLLPSPYALKMAILDVAIATSGLPAAESAWPWIRDLAIGIQLPRQIVVTNVFARVLRLRRSPAGPGDADAGPFQKTIGYREYVYHSDALSLVFGLPDGKSPQLAAWLPGINYLGKRGGFVQLLAAPTVVNDAAGRVLLTSEADTFPVSGLIQQLDDCDPKMKFAEADIYNKKRPKRVVRHVVLPYQLARSSRSYSLYETVESSDAEQRDAP